MFVCLFAVNAKTMSRIDAKRSGITKNDLKAGVYASIYIISSMVTWTYVHSINRWCATAGYAQHDYYVGGVLQQGL